MTDGRVRRVDDTVGTSLLLGGRPTSGLFTVGVSMDLTEVVLFLLLPSLLMDTGDVH